MTTLNWRQLYEDVPPRQKKSPTENKRNKVKSKNTTKKSSKVPKIQNDDTGIHLCKYCLKTYPKQSYLKRHITISHTGKLKSHECEECGKFFSQRCTLFRHYKNCHKDKTTFSSWGDTASKKSDLDVYMQLQDVNDPKKCKECGKTFVKPCTLYRHVRTCHSEIWNRFSNDPIQKKVIEKRKPSVKRKVVCKNTDNSSAEQTSSSTFKNTHGEQTNPCKCKECGREFSQIVSLNRHFKSAHAETRYTCKLCGKGFIQSSSLNRHMGTHGSVMSESSCTQCGKTFSDKFVLNRHMNRVHKIAAPYECTQCNTKFTQLSSYYRHSRQFHSPSDAYQCGICGQKFADDSILKIHLEVHSSQITNVCPICNRRFGKRCSLYRHMRDLHGEEEESDLKILHNVSTGKKRFRDTNKTSQIAYFKCNQCREQFTTMPMLSHHLKEVHCETAHNACEICGQTFMEQSILNLHMTVHGDYDEQNSKSCRRNFRHTPSKRTHKLQHVDPNIVKDSFDEPMESYSGQNDQESDEEQNSLQSFASSNNNSNQYSDGEAIESSEETEKGFLSIVSSEKLQFLDDPNVCETTESTASSNASSEQLPSGNVSDKTETVSKTLIQHNSDYGEVQEDNEYACDECQKTFISWSFLNRHIRQFH